MRWKKVNRKGESKPFLVLPLEIYDLTTVRKKPTMVRKKPNLKLFVRTNVTANKENDFKETDRPLTATLEKPQVLDIRFLGKIDMSLMRKEFLTISNLCLPLTKANNAINTNTYKKTKSAFKTYRKRTLKSAMETDDEMSSCDTKISSHRRKAVTGNDSSNNKPTPRGQVKPVVSLPEEHSSSRTSNPNDVRSSVSNNNRVIISTGTPVNKAASVKSTKQPQSCSSCGRSDRPERFHTHPPKRATVRQSPSPSKQGLVSPKRSLGSASNEMNKEKPKENNKVEKKTFSSSSKVTTGGSGDQVQVKRRGPRTLICYLCGREYGTASLRLHEPKCIEKWQRENAKLPKHLRRPLPQKPENPMTPEEWNDIAWKTMQETLVPCKSCSRTFLPDRLEVHQRSCKSAFSGGQEKSEQKVRSQHFTPASASPSRGVKCSYCGRIFGTHSIKIHGENCHKKLEMQNMQNNNYISSCPGSEKNLLNRQYSDQDQTVVKPDKTPERRPKILPCYLCGRPFSLSSIYIHEPQCLKKWKIENEKLPPSKRRPLPTRPDFKFTPTGELDCEGTYNRIWDNHLSELIPCKICGRTFFPDRIMKHENACAGTGIKIKNVK